jgi:hypothetical protein
VPWGWGAWGFYAKLWIKHSVGLTYQLTVQMRPFSLRLWGRRCINTTRQNLDFLLAECVFPFSNVPITLPAHQAEELVSSRSPSQWQLNSGPHAQPYHDNLCWLGHAMDSSRWWAYTPLGIGKDDITWTRTIDDTNSMKSAYEMQFDWWPKSTLPEKVWKIWASSHCKFIIWLML